MRRKNIFVLATSHSETYDKSRFQVKQSSRVLS